MALVCPNKNHPLYKTVLNMVGGDERTLYRLFARYNQTNPNEELEKIVETYNPDLNPISARIEQIKRARGSMQRNDEEHRYFFPDNPSMDILSVTRSIDSIPELAYRGSSKKKGYSDTGTKIHELSAMIFGVSEQNVRRKMTEWDLPPEIYSSLKSRLNELTLDGSVLIFEPMLFSGIFDQSISPIAGAADIIRFRPDGTYQVVDMKTVHLTPSVREYLKKNPKSNIWNPSLDNNYKAKRYSTQLMAYGRLLEKALGIAPSDYLILPIELETEGDREDGRIIKATVLPYENINQYGFKDYANRNLDTIFKEKSFEPSTIGSTRFKDILANFYTKLTGDVSNSTGNPKEIAEIIHKRSGKQGVQKGYYLPGKVFVPYKNQQSKDAQISQIVDEYVNKDVRADMENSVINYLNSPTGDETYLSNMGASAKDVIYFLKNFAGKKNIVVSALNTLPGFEDKSNWILITEKYEKSSLTHLLYVGQDNFQTTFTTKNFNVFDYVNPNTSIFGKFISENETRSEIGTNLKNNVGDARVLEATMIAMRLKADNPDIKFGIMNLFGMSGNKAGRVVDLKENLHTIKSAIENKTLREELFSDSFLEMTNTPGIFDYQNYQGSWLDSLIHSFETYYRQYDKSGIIDKIKDYASDATRKNELIDYVADLINQKLEMGVSPTNDYNMFLLSRFYLELQRINVSLTPSNVFAAEAGVPSLLKNTMLQAVTSELQNAQTQMIDGFWKYKDKHVPFIANLFKSKTFTSRGIDRLTGDTSRHYFNLFKTMKVKIATETGFEEKEVPIFEFKTEGSPEFLALTKEEQDIITKTNDALAELGKLSNFEWERGRVPMVRARVGEKFLNAIRNNNKNYSDVVSDYLIDMDASFGAGEDSREPTLYNIFRNQTGDGSEDKRNQQMGLQSEGFLNEVEYRKYSFDVEMIADIYAMQALKHKYMNGVAASMKAVNNVFNWYRSGLVGERLDGNIAAINNLFTVNVTGTDLDNTETARKASQYMRLLSRAASTYYIGFDFVAAGVATLGNELTLFSQSIANLISKTTGITPKSSAKAKAIITKALSQKSLNTLSGNQYGDYEKISLLMRSFRMMNNDVTQAISGYHREGEKFLLQGKYMFSVMNAGEWESRATLMIGQMLEDGTWDSIGIDSNGNLTYDESKDLRLNGKGKYTIEEGKAIKKMLSQSMGLTVNDKLPFPYTSEMGGSIRNTANFLFGSSDRDMKSFFNYRWWGKMFISLKNWLPAKIQRWTMSRVDSSTIGSLKIERNPQTNEIVASFQGDQLEGIFLSLAAGYNNMFKRYIKKMETKPLTKFQKNNITRALGDLIIVLSGSLAYMAIPDDEDDTVYDDITAEIIRRSLDDLMVIYNVLKIDDYFYTPIPLKMANTVIQNVEKMLTDGPTFEEVMPFVPGGASIIQQWEMLEIEEENENNEESLN